VVVDHGAVPILVKLLSSPSDDVREQVYLFIIHPLFIFLLNNKTLILKAAWTLGNIAGDSPSCRDLVLGHGALIPLLSQLNEQEKLSMLRIATWALSNFCRGKPPPPFEQVVVFVKLKLNM